MKIIAIIVIYMPNFKELISAIDDIMSLSVDVCIVDNSEPNQEFDFSILNPKVKLIQNFSNLGIAKAQNIGIKANLREYNYFLFLDQDSKLSKNFILDSKDFLEDKNVFIQVPVVRNKVNGNIYYASKISKIGLPKKVNMLNESKFQLIDIGISSGTLVKKKVFESMIYFREDLFIDFVDIEWFLKCKKKNFKVYQNNLISLLHQIGGEEKKFIGKNILVHNEVRIYYKTRNIFLMFRDEFNLVYLSYQLVSSLILNLLNVIFIENRLLGLKMYLKGILHGFYNKGGKLE